MPRSQNINQVDLGKPAQRAAAVRAQQEAHQQELLRQQRIGQIRPSIPVSRHDQNAQRTVTEQQRRQVRQLPAVAQKTGQAQRGY